jgi:N,N'-diacetylchitobiose transport system permease protein
MSATGIEATVPGAPGIGVDADIAALEAGPKRRRRRRPGQGDKIMPYWLSLPTLLIVIAVFGYPFVKMIIMSFQEKSLHNLFRDVGPTWAGLKQYRAALTDSVFWTVTLRTVIFTASVVVASVILSLLVALLLNHCSRWAKILLTTVLMFVWAVPQVVSIQLFSWLTDPDFSVINWLLSKLPGVDMMKHDWFRDPHQGLAVAGAVVVWGAIPFLAVTLHAGMTMVPKELNEAAEIDGAGAWRRFRAVTLPVLRPLLVIITTLSVIWDIQVFNQIFLLRHQSPEQSYWTLATYVRNVAIQGSNYYLASALGVITVLLMLGVMVFYIRQIFRIGDYE